jgi:hypothetical protein
MIQYNRYDQKFQLAIREISINRGGRKDWRVEMALIQIRVPARES